MERYLPLNVILNNNLNCLGIQHNFFFLNLVEDSDFTSYLFHYQI
jgi:hypothetical protein